MSESGARFYDFAGFRLDGQTRQLLHGGSPLPLAPKAVDVLLCLIRNRPRIVSKDEILEAVWPDTVVEEGNLSQNISLLRKALGERQSTERLIVTVSGRGYRFAGDVIESNAVVPAHTSIPQSARSARTSVRTFTPWGASAVLAAALGWLLLRPVAPPVDARERQVTTNSPELSITALALRRTEDRLPMPTRKGSICASSSPGKRMRCRIRKAHASIAFPGFPTAANY